MTTDNPTPEGFKEYMNTKGSGINVLNLMPGETTGGTSRLCEE